MKFSEATATSRDDVTFNFDLKPLIENSLTTSLSTFSMATAAAAPATATTYKVYVDQARTQEASATATVQDDQLTLTLDAPVTESTKFYVTVTEYGKYESIPVELTVHPYQMSDDATLAALSYTVNGADAVTVPSFDPNTYAYNLILPSNTAKDAVINLVGQTADPLALITAINGVTLTDGKGSATLVVTAEDDNILTYRVTFTVKAETDVKPDKDEPVKDGNEPGKELPDTNRSMDAIIYSIAIGIVLLATAGVLLLINRRKSKQV